MSPCHPREGGDLDDKRIIMWIPDRVGDDCVKQYNYTS